MKRIGLKLLLSACLGIILIGFLYFTSCNKINNNDVELKKEISLELKSNSIDYGKYSEYGIFHNKCLDIIKNDPDFEKVISDPNFMITILKNNLGTDYIYDYDLSINNYNYSENAKKLLGNKLITENEYNHILFISNFPKYIEKNYKIESLDITIVKDEIFKYLDNLLSNVKLTDHEEDFIVGGSFVFINSCNYWFEELYNEKSSWYIILKKYGNIPDGNEKGLDPLAGFRFMNAFIVELANHDDNAYYDCIASNRTRDYMPDDPKYLAIKTQCQSSASVASGAYLVNKIK